MASGASRAVDACSPPAIAPERNDQALAVADAIAERIIASFAPASVYDAGCALGLLVEQLRARGVAAHGRDSSGVAMAKVRPEPRGFCDIGDLAAAAPAPGHFDLVTCLDTLEHLPEPDALAALDVLTAAAPRILFSSSPGDVTEPTCPNAHPVLYWLRQFVARGFSPDWTHDAGYVAPHAFAVVRHAPAPNEGELRSFADAIRLRVALAACELRVGRLSGEVSAGRAREAAALAQLTPLRLEAAWQARALRELQDSATQSGGLTARLELDLAAARQRARAIETSTTWRASALARTLVNRIPGARAVLAGTARRIGTARTGKSVTPDGPPPPPGASLSVAYDSWIAQQVLQDCDADLQRRLALELAHRPLVSVLTPVYRIAADILADTIASVVAQTYGNWELCLAVADTADLTRMRMLRDWAARDGRIRIEVLAGNFGISGNSDAALAMARGEWAVLLDHDDMLTSGALFELVRALNDDPAVDFIYSDKDQIAADGTTRQRPLFKPAWTPDIMLSANYLTHLNMMRVDRLRQIGGWDGRTDGAQDWDLFLRVIGRTGRVRHIAKVLYHWRQVPSSVAGGGAAAKPYAAEAQLRVIGGHLGRSGWPDAQPRFEGPFIRIGWGSAWRPSVTLVILAHGPAAPVPIFAWPDPVEILAAPGAVAAGARVVPVAARNPAAILDALVDAARGDIVVVWDGGLAAAAADWLAELVGPLANPDIVVVGGTVIDPDGVIVAQGAVFADGRIRPGFEGVAPDSSGVFGSPSWYRNASMTPLRLAALRRADWQREGGCLAAAEAGRPDLALTLRLGQAGGRILLNPFARAIASRPDPFEGDGPAATARMADRLAAAWPGGDPSISPNLVFAETGWMTFRAPRAGPVADHNFHAEARYSAAAYDATAEDVRRSVARCTAAPAGPLERACWVVPQFDVPFYGGIHTILRAADHMLARHRVAPVFAVTGQADSGIMRARIALAFPRLAAAATIHMLPDAETALSCGPVDALISTLWVTAFPALRETQARRKFNFLQDWEPLFYPAGSLSGLVEATYRFGFHAVCNTESLAGSYRALGGTAEHFQPAIDPAIFHPRREGRPGDGPFRLFCYMRPAAPRNCFETLSAALRDLKRRHGEGIEIVTAGAPWDPAAHGLDGVVRHLGLLPYARTGELYRACDAGLVAMATRHPCYLPLEFMACGAAVVTNRNPHTEWLLRDGENAALCDLTRGDVARAVDGLIADTFRLTAIVQGGYDTVRRDHADWDATCARIHAIIAAKCRAP